MAANPPTLTLRLVKDEPLTAAEMDTNLTALKAYTLAAETQILNGTSTFTNNAISGNIIDGGTISNFASTGIDDNADGIALTIDSAEKATFSGAMAVAGVSTFTGAITASGGVLGNAATATTATNVTVVEDNSTALTSVALFAGTAAGGLGCKISSGMTFNAANGSLTTTNVYANLIGNSSTATALATGRTIAMTGDVAWTSPSFDGSGNVTATGVIQANAVELSMLEHGTQGDVLYYGASGAPARLAKPATAAGQVLTFAASATEPSWEASSDAGDLTTVTSTQTWTKPTGVSLIHVTVYGGGAGSTAEASGSGGSGDASTGNGGAGAVVSDFIDVSAISSVGVTIGVAGTAGHGLINFAGYNAGGVGGATSFGSYLTAGGGQSQTGTQYASVDGAQGTATTTSYTAISHLTDNVVWQTGGYGKGGVGGVNGGGYTQDGEAGGAGVVLVRVIG